MTHVPAVCVCVCLLAAARAAGAETVELMVCPGTAENARNSEGDVLELKDGRLLLAYSEFYTGGGGDHDKSRISGKLSSDGGRTWSRSFTLQENVGQKNVMSASLLRLKSGRIALAFLRKDSLSDCRPLVKFSDDEAKTWSEPVLVTERVAYYCVNNARLVQLSTGRLLMPASITPDVEKQYHFRSFCFYSDDEGKTWKAGKEIDLGGTGADEPGVVELKDGRVMMLIRTNLGWVYQAFSGDGGVTWQDVGPTELRAPAAPATVVRIPATGDLLAFWNFASGRHRLSSAISRDEGRTWESIRDIENDKSTGFAYVSATFAGDDVLLTYFQYTKPTISNKLRRLPVKWFHGGKGRSLRMVAFGDSVTKGVRPGVKEEETFRHLLQEGLIAEGYPTRVINAGIGGNNTDQAMKRLKEDVLDHRPHVVLIMFGLNDAAMVDGGPRIRKQPRVLLPKYTENLRSMVKESTKAGAVAVLCTCNPMTEAYAHARLGAYAEHGINHQVERYAQAVRDLAEEMNAPLVDAYKLYEGKPERLKLIRDGCHPYGVGHKLIADELRGCILGLVQSGKLPATK